MPEGEHNALFWQPDQGRPWSKIAAAIAAALIIVGVVVFFVVADDDDAPAPDPAAVLPPTASDEPAPQPATPESPPAAQPAAQPAVQPAQPPQPAEPQPAEPQPAEPQPAEPQPAEPQPAEPQPAATPAPPTAASPPAGLDACVAKHFAPGAFAGELPKFDFVCTRADPRKGAVELSARLVYAQKKKPVTDAMKEWSILNWYELAFFAIAQRACCKAAPPLDTKVGKACDFDAKLTALGDAGHTGKNLDEAIQAFDKSVQCLINFQLAAHYKQTHPTYGPERDAFRRISLRSRQ